MSKISLVGVFALVVMCGAVPQATTGLNPDFPVVSGRYQFTDGWALRLPGAFNRRYEDGALVIWRPGVTVWILVWNNDLSQTAAKRLDRIIADSSPEKFAVSTARASLPMRFSYRLNETKRGPPVYAVYGFVVSKQGHVQVAVYSDHESDVALGEAIIGSIEEVPPNQAMQPTG